MSVFPGYETLEVIFQSLEWLPTAMTTSTNLTKSPREVQPQVKKKPIELLVPAGTDWDAIFTGELAPYKEEGIYIKSLAMRSMIADKKGRQNPFYAINCKRLRKVVPDRVITKIIKALKDHNQIRDNGRSYRQGICAIGYGLVTDAKAVATKVYTIKNEKLAEKIRKDRELHPQEINTPHFKELKAFFGELSIDREAAMRDIEATDYEQREWKEGIKSAEEAKNYDKMCVEAIFTGHIYFSIDYQKRVHTNVTNMSARLRRHLTFRGEKFVNIDTRNSQPLMLCIPLKKGQRGEVMEMAKLIYKYAREGVGTDAKRSFEGEKKRKEEEAKEIAELIKGAIVGYEEEEVVVVEGEEKGSKIQREKEAKVSQKVAGNSHTLDGEYPRRPGKQRKMTDGELACRCVAVAEKFSALTKKSGKEIEKYQNLCCSGQLYEHLRGLLPDGHKLLEMERGDFKKQVFKCCIFAEKKVAEGEFGALFKKEFPAIYEMIWLLKSLHHAVLPKMLQCYEAELIPRLAARRFMDACPGECVLTVHDAFLVTERNAAAAEHAIKSVLLEAGLAATVTTVPA